MINLFFSLHLKQYFAISCAPWEQNPDFQMRSEFSVLCSSQKLYLQESKSDD